MFWHKNTGKVGEQAKQTPASMRGFVKSFNRGKPEYGQCLDYLGAFPEYSQ